MSYVLSFAAIASLIVYTYLHHSKTIWRQYKNSTSEKPDIHMKLMKKYKEAPSWWYTSLFVIVSLLRPTIYAARRFLPLSNARSRRRCWGWAS